VSAAGESLVVAKLGPSTGWVGKTIVFQQERLTLEGFRTLFVPGHTLPLAYVASRC
jgi:hypothetical protein